MAEEIISIGYGIDHTKVQSCNPLTGKAVYTGKVSTIDEVENTLANAASAYEEYRYFSGEQKAEFLDAIAEEILALGEELLHMTVSETGLSLQRIEGERARTVGQLRMFADLLREGSWVEATIDTAIPGRSPAPRPDLRKMLVAVGPVVVFSASNFPLAFSTAGGDTASALAAGNPVVLKAHNAHLGTNSLISSAILTAAERTNMPHGIFSTLTGEGHRLGQQLVMHKNIKSVAFTGSHSGGMSLYKLAAQREQPIPVFAEMGSVNPVIILPEKLSNSKQELAEQYVGSLTLGAGQFCTNPGLLILIKGEESDEFIAHVGKLAGITAPAPMLSEQIWSAYLSASAGMISSDKVDIVAKAESREGQCLAIPVVASVKGSDFIQTRSLCEEVFGPFGLIVICVDKEEVIRVLRHVGGALTTTIWATDEELKKHRDLVNSASGQAGRLILNGMPTGVEVCAAMHHGGPSPASTDSRFTSVGTDAIKRFVRPVTYQNFPDQALPAELRDTNPLKIWRTINGELSKERIDA